MKIERRLRAVRLCPDEWMDALSIDLYHEHKRGKVEALQWKLAKELLALGLTVIIEWGTWARSERDTLRLGARALGAARVVLPRCACGRPFWPAPTPRQRISADRTRGTVEMVRGV